MSIKFYDVCTKREYEKDGQKKAVWMNVGKLKVLDGGKMFIELPMFPETTFYVFEQKPKEESQSL